MATGREARASIIDGKAEFIEQHERNPSLVRLPVLMANDFAKSTHDEIGDLSEQLLIKGIDVLEEVGLYGMSVEITRRHDALLSFE